eukprot:EG_transcript_16699
MGPFRCLAEETPKLEFCDNVLNTCMCVTIDDDYPHAVADAMLAAPISKHIRLRACTLRDGDVLPIARALSSATSVEHLDLRDNELRTAGAEIVARALLVNTTLRQLTLCQNEIDASGACAVAEALRVNSTLHTLDFSMNNLFGPGARAMAEALKVNSALRWLDLSGVFGGTCPPGCRPGGHLPATAVGAGCRTYASGIPPDGARALAEAVTVNSTLRHLDLSANEFGSVGARALAEAMRVNSNLQHLDLSLEMDDDVALTTADILMDSHPPLALQLDECSRR